MTVSGQQADAVTSRGEVIKVFTLKTIPKQLASKPPAETTQAGSSDLIYPCVEPPSSPTRTVLCPPQ